MQAPESLQPVIWKEDTVFESVVLRGFSVKVAVVLEGVPNI